MITNPKDFFQQIQNLCEGIALKIKAISDSLSSFLTKADAEATYLDKTEASNTYLGKDEKAASATVADSATSANKATNDANGNNISNTYLKSTTAASTYLKQSDADSKYLGKTAKAESAKTADTATSATSAGTATKAIQDGDGNVISGTYLKSATAQSTYLSKDGNRGQLAGYETPTVTASAVTINADSNDTTQVTGAVAVTVATGAEGTSWTKTVSLVNASATVTLGDAWVWSGGEAPTVSENGILVLHWCNDVGVASLIDGANIFRTYTGTVSAPSGSNGVEVVRSGVAIYRVSPGASLTCEMAVGDLLGSSAMGVGASISTPSKITFDSNGYVTALEDGFSVTAGMYGSLDDQ